jgi:Domain of unknown function (DUF4159)
MRVALVLTVCLLLAGAALAQRFGGLSFQGHDDGPEATFPAKGEFHFIRVEYTDLPRYQRGFGFVSRNGRGNGWWMQDWPDADDHFSTGVQRLTRVETGQPLHLSLTDDKLFDNPWVYATQTGYWDLDNAEIARLREYLLRGGFLMVDDFWGPDSDQWEVFKETMQKVLPNKPISDIAGPDPVMHVLYDIGEKDRSFIPGTRHLRGGPGGTVVVQQPFGTNPAWRAMYDDKNRLIVAVNYNTDIGDAWEYADAPEYPEHMTSLAYRYGINYLVYSMTH